MVSGLATLALFATSAMASVYQPRQIVSNSTTTGMTSASGTGASASGTATMTSASSSSAGMNGASSSSTGMNAASSSTTSATSSASSSASTGVSPAVGSTLTVGGRAWRYDGCLSSSSNFQTFSLEYNSLSQTLESCLSAVPATSRYAGLFEGACYFATILDAATAVGNGVCNIKCSANSTQVCGGRVNMQKRQATNAMLLSLYESVPAVTIGQTTNSSGTVINNINNGIQIGSINYVTQVYNYFAACGCAAGVTATALTTTLAYAACGCASQTVPTLPMTATTAVVSGSTITLTVPCTATATGSAVYYNGTCVGAGCPVATASTMPALAIGTGVPTASSGMVVVCNGVNCPIANPASPSSGSTVVCNSGVCVAATGSSNAATGSSNAATQTVTAYVSAVTKTVTVANSACAAASSSGANTGSNNAGNNNAGSSNNGASVPAANNNVVYATSATVNVVPVASSTNKVVTYTGAASKASGAFGALAVVGLAALAL